MKFKTLFMNHYCDALRTLNKGSFPFIILNGKQLIAFFMALFKTFTSSGGSNP